MTKSATDWIGFWDSEHSIYVNARHFDVHYRDIADHIIALGFPPTARLLDYGCGEALHADSVAARAGELWLCESAARVRANLRERFSHVGNIRVTDPEQIKLMPDGAFDLIVANSVIQYWSRETLDATLQTWRRLLAPQGRLVLADVIPSDAGAISDALALLRHAARNGFFVASIIGLFRTALSPYQRLRTQLGIATYSEQEIAECLRRNGFSSQRLPYNFEHQQERMTFVAVPAQ